jgi:peptide/nickel transport system permease protein
MTRYLIRRLLQSIPLLLLVSVCVFLMIELSPIDPMAIYEDNPDLSHEDRMRIRRQLGLDEPVHVRYVKWLGNMLQGDWGTSNVTWRSARTEIADRLPNTLYLMGISFVTTLLLAIPLGIISAVRQYSWIDYLVTAFALVWRSIPIFWFGLMLIIIFHVTLRNPATGAPLFPGSGMYDLRTKGLPGYNPVLDYAHHLVLPLTMLTLFGAARYTRFMRASMLDVIHQDYIRTARSKGLSERAVTYGHALKNAAIPLVTVMALDLPSLFSGALYTETIFGWPGMGRLFYRSAQRVDYAVLMATVMLNAALIVLFQLAADVAYAYLNPRIRFS